MTPISTPLLSVIILNYNGLRWVDRCVQSLKEQTIFSQIEILIADNQSTDSSDKAFEKAIEGWPNARFIQNGGNFGFCEGNNLPAKVAKGKFLLFLNNDVWLEPDCLEILMREVQAANAQSGMSLILNYDDDTVQTAGGAGFDIFGFISWVVKYDNTREIFIPNGCCFLIEKDLFDKLGGFDREFFMYADEYDLAWRLWAAGGKAVLVPASRMHHRSAANVNPKGSGKIVELRTSDMKRFYANRNTFLLLLKNCQNILFLLLPMQITLVAVEALVLGLVTRRWSYIENTFFKALSDCWRLRHHVRNERRKLAQLRARSDWWMLRFLCWRLNRWYELMLVRKLGLPKVMK